MEDADITDLPLHKLGFRIGGPAEGTLLPVQFVWGFPLRDNPPEAQQRNCNDDAEEDRREYR